MMIIGGLIGALNVDPASAAAPAAIKAKGKKCNSKNNSPICIEIRKSTAALKAAVSLQSPSAASITSGLAEVYNLKTDMKTPLDEKLRKNKALETACNDACVTLKKLTKTKIFRKTFIQHCSELFVNECEKQKAEADAKAGAESEVETKKEADTPAPATNVAVQPTAGSPEAPVNPTDTTKAQKAPAGTKPSKGKKPPKTEKTPSAAAATPAAKAAKAP